MSEKNTNIDSTFGSLFNGMSDVISSNSVIGEAIHVGETIILPLVDVSFCMAAGTFSETSKGKGNGGVGGKLTPCACLVVNNGNIKLVNIKNQDSVTKLIDLIPDAVDKISGFFSGAKNNDDVDVDAVINEVMESSEE